MKKIILLAIMMIMAATAWPQASVPSVCGIKAGMARDEVKSILKDRFGYSSVTEESGNLKVIDGSVGGISHTFMTFYFAWVDGKSRFNGAELSTPFELNKQKDAIAHRELIKSVYERKYDIIESKDDNGFKKYYFGIGQDLYGIIYVDKAEGKDGKTRLYTTVYYRGIYNNTDDI